MKTKFFTGIVVILLAYVLGSLGVSRISHFNHTQNISLIISGILASLNVVTAFLIIIFTLGKDFTKFVRVFIFGVALRLLILLAIIFIIFKFMDVDNFVFISSLFILYFIFQLWELIIINKHLKQE